MPFDILYIFLPLFIGYLVVIKNKLFLKEINRLTGKLVYFILGLMGVSLASLENLSENFGQIALITAIFFSFITFCNLSALPFLDHLIKTDVKTHRCKISLIKMFMESLKLIIFVMVGFIFGLLISFESQFVDQMSEITLLLLLLLIGIELRNSGIALKQILLNTKGIAIAGVVTITSLIGGLVSAWFLDIPYQHGLAMASGFGWYSLAGILMTDALGPVYGGASFLIELFRELTAILLIPMCIHRYPCTAIGYSGATALDFTLPIIQTSGGVKCVPIAIVSGFILSLLVPLMMVFFISFG